MEDYKEIKDLLTPRRDIKASARLRCRVGRAIENDRRKSSWRNFIWGGISLSAAAAVILLLLVPSRLSAKEILAEAISAMREAGNIEMVVEVRTRAIENFRYIDLHEDFVSHHIDISGADSVREWRIDKGDRVAVGRGGDIHTWIPALNLGMHLGNADRDDLLGYLANLLTPGRILETELNNCTNSSGSEYMVTRNGDEIWLTVHAGPEGNFENPYLLNTSIAESENIRRYVIDSRSKRLKSATVSVLSGNKETVVLKISSISYDSGPKNICRLPSDIHFIETEEGPSGLKGLSAEEAAATVLNAFSDWDTSILDKVLTREIAGKLYRDEFSGSKLISVGNAFTSGSENSTFVPYTLRLKDGSLRRHNIAIQKNDSDAWIVVGGL